MKIIILILAFTCSICVVHAKHITGGEMIYDYLGPGSTPNSKIFRITLRLFRDDNCFDCAGMPATVSIGIYSNNNNALIGTFRSVAITNFEQLPMNTLPSCITNPPTLTYTAGYYVYTTELPDNTSGYTAAYQTCCRIDGIMNIPNNIGATYITQIPGTSILGAIGTDNSPRFSQGISVVCYNKPFTLNFSATDPDGDSLVYSMCPAYSGGGATSGSPNPSNYPTPAPPPYTGISYINSYSGGSPLGSNAFINTQTGIISGIAPGAGKYVVSVCVDAYNRTSGQLISTHRKDFIVTVAPCDFAGAQLQPGYISCDGFTFNFSNLNTSPLNVSFLWDFGDGNTSSEQNPTHTYTTAGIYTLKLVVNPGGSCLDSTTSELRVFPGFFPGITDNSPMCKSIPVQFNDATTLNYGSVNSWKWDFGIAVTTNDTSRLRNPAFTFDTAGTYDVTLMVGSDRGCLDTLVKTIRIVDRAEFLLPNDTLICSIDTFQIKASASSLGTVVWSPNYMINDVNSFTPLVSPDVTTTYTALFQDSFGCSATETITINVVNNVTLRAGIDTTVCRTDTFILTLNSNALKYTWTPSLTLNNGSIKNPVATPTAALTNYRVRGTIGKCFTEDDIEVKTVPYPAANAGKDTTICFGNSLQLQATGGSVYTWRPNRYLNSSTISNPVSQNPVVDIRYIVEVRDVLGCPKPAFDTINVTVAQIMADAGPGDTSIVLGQPLQLTASGSTFYSWIPVTWLNNPTILNPISMPQDNIEYVVKVSNAQGCFDLDSINVKVFKIDPDLLVPTGFSPDGDGNNDVFRPILIGMKSLDLFKVYNRWGQLVYSTTQAGAGWDGKFGGAPQSAGSFVWFAEGTNYLGKKINKKGSVILIR